MVMICTSAVCTHDVRIPWLKGMLVTRIWVCLYQKTIYSLAQKLGQTIADCHKHSLQIAQERALLEDGQGDRINMLSL